MTLKYSVMSCRKCGSGDIIYKKGNPYCLKCKRACKEQIETLIKCNHCGKDYWVTSEHRTEKHTCKQCLKKAKK